MTSPCSPCTSSSNSCISDSETSNDSGNDSLSGGSLPPDFMDLDEFLRVTGVKCIVKEYSCESEVTHKDISKNQKTKDEQCSNTANVQYLKDSTDKSDSIKDIGNEENDIDVAPKAQSSRKREEEEYTYNYNPLPVKKKAKRKFVADQEKDDQYWKRRIRNNQAARRSRDMRRQREIEISSKWRELERENARLKKELEKLKQRANELEQQLLEKEK